MYRVQERFQRKLDRKRASSTGLNSEESGQFLKPRKQSAFETHSAQASPSLLPRFRDRVGSWFGGYSDKSLLSVDGVDIKC
uniref:Uncharacterized protein n=1 Tax=Panagrolaimus sp. PS1159 TaxID=55785 RepID=A0AC35G3Y4_9BILA